MSAFDVREGVLFSAIGARHPAQAADDLAGAHAFGADLAHRLPELGEIRLGHVEVTRAGARVGGDGGERLVDLVGDAGGQFTDGGEARHARQPVLRQVRVPSRSARSVTSAPEHSQPAGVPSAARRATQRQ